MDFLKSFFAVEKSTSESGERMTVGLMTVGGVDSDGEIVDQASALDAMPRFQAAGGPVTFNHGMGGNIGRMVDFSGVRRHGSRWVDTTDPERVQAIKVRTLYGKGYNIQTMFGATMSVDDIWAQIDQGMLATHSIGFIGRRQASVGGPGEAPRILVDRVLEYAVVTVPAKEDATFSVSRMLKSAKLCAACARRLGLDPSVPSMEECDGDNLEDVARALREAARMMKG